MVFKAADCIFTRVDTAINNTFRLSTKGHHESATAGVVGGVPEGVKLPENLVKVADASFTEVDAASSDTCY